MHKRLECGSHHCRLTLLRDLKTTVGNVLASRFSRRGGQLLSLKKEKQSERGCPKGADTYLGLAEHCNGNLCAVANWVYSKRGGKGKILRAKMRI
jgi:hypothetical protein